MTTSIRPDLLALAALALGGCSSTHEPPVSMEPPPFVADACQHALGGVASSLSPAVGLARAHAKLRFFGVTGDRRRADETLTAALAAAFPVSEATLTAYASGGDACVVPPAAGPLGAAQVTMMGDVAIIQPGTGPVTLPAEAKAAAIDLRAVPQVPGTLDALAAAVAAVSIAAVTLPTAQARTCSGLPDEAYNVVAKIPPADLGYACVVKPIQGRVIAPLAARALPLAVLTGEKVAPDAALVAVALRLSGAAWLLGEDVLTAVAESEWVSVGASGASVRTRALVDSGSALLPDVVPADDRLTDPTLVLADLAARGAPPAITGAAARPQLRAMPDLTTAPPNSTDPEVGRAALIIVNATLRTFYPYFDVVPDVIDARLDSELAGLDPVSATDRHAVSRALQRLTQPLDDAHCALWWFAPPPSTVTGYPAGALLSVGKGFVFGVSGIADIQPGDTLIASGGMSTDALVAKYTQYESGSPQHVRSVIGDYDLVPLTGTITVQSPGGPTKDVTVSPVPTWLDTFGMFDRASGPLADLGVPDVYYMNLDAEGPNPISAAAVTAFTAALPSVTGGVVLDLRGYPGPPSWDALAAVVGQTATGPALAFEDVTSTSFSFDPVPTQTMADWSSNQSLFSGKVVLLVGPDTLSQAEHLTFFYRSTKRGPVLGTPTAGANGTVTGVQLPGGYGLVFTGMRVTFPDGTRFHGLGITPDITSEPTAADLAAGTDTVLLRALAYLKTGM